MRFYLEKRNVFLKMSIFILIVSLVLIFCFNFETFGYFLLGIFASTMIITIECNMSAKVEEGKLLIDKLKKLRDELYEFYEFESFSLDHFSVNFEDKYNKFKNKLEYIFNLNDSLGNVNYLNKKTKENLDIIVKRIFDLEISLYFIFENFDNQNKKMKIIYFMEFYKILKEFKFRELLDIISNLGWDLDSKEFYRHDFKETKERTIEKMKYETSIDVYNKKLEIINSIEYKALKKQFEKFMKSN